MKQEKINDNKVRFILDQQDLEERNINTAELAYGSSEAKALFDELMDLARETLGLTEGVYPMMVEAIPMREKGLVVNISRVDNPDELDPRFSRFSRGLEYDEPGGPENGRWGSGQDMPFYDEDGREETDPTGPDGFRDIDGPGGDPGFPGIAGPDGPGDGPFGPDMNEADDASDGPVPDGIQIQQGPEIRAQINIPKSSSLEPKDIMSMIDNIVSGLAGKISGGGDRVTPPKKKEPGPGASGGPGDRNTQSVDPFALYEFRDLQTVIRAAKLLNQHYDSENVLYKNPVNRRFYLYLGREHNSVQEFAAATAILNELGSRCRISYASREYFEEHMEKILENAIMQLAELEDL